MVEDSFKCPKCKEGLFETTDKDGETIYECPNCFSTAYSYWYLSVGQFTGQDEVKDTSKALNSEEDN